MSLELENRSDGAAPRENRVVHIASSGSAGPQHAGHRHEESGVHVHAEPLAATSLPGRPSAFLASALDRLLLAIVVSGLIWLGVLWAIV